jgi:hypothetical protein
MTDPPPGFRDQLNAAIAILEPDLAGLNCIMLAMSAGPAQAAIAAEMEARGRRRQMIGEVLVAMDTVADLANKLVADGYPSLEPAIVSKSIFDYLQSESKSFIHGVSLFVPAYETGEASPEPGQLPMDNPRQCGA